MIPGAKVFLLIPRVLKDLEGKEGVRLIGRSTQIECRLIKETEEGSRAVYSIQPLTNPPGRCYYEIQVEEGWEPNTGQVVTNMSGQKLNPRWGGWKKPDLHRSGFRSSRELIAVKAYMIRSYGTLTRFLLTQESRDKLLVVEIIGQFKFSVEKNEIETEKEEHEHLIPAAKAAIGRAVCNCPKKGCASHYAMSKEEAEVWETRRRERQKVAVETARTKAAETAEAPAEEEGKEGAPEGTAAPVEFPIEEIENTPSLSKQMLTPGLTPEPIPKPDFVPVPTSGSDPISASPEKAQRKASREKKTAKKRVTS